MLDVATLKQLVALRAPFPEDAVSLKPVYTGEYDYGDDYEGRIPKSAYGVCDVCGRTHALPAKHLRYVGHARITERLNSVDPEWDWRPLAVDDAGLPVVRGGSMWIELTVCGITKKGVGDAGDKFGPNATKEMVGDAIRNAAMRFGCGLEMWFDQDDAETDISHRELTETAPDTPFEVVMRPNATKAQKRLADALADISKQGYDARLAAHAIFEEYGRRYYELNQQEVEDALELLSGMFKAASTDEEIEVIEV